MSDEKVSESTVSNAVNEDEEVVGEIEQEVVDAEVLVEEEPDLETQLVEAQAQAAEYLDGWQRARAELANFKKRIERERAEWETTLRSDLILELLPVLDDFDLALDNLPQEIADHEWVDGVTLIHRKLLAQLEKLGLGVIETGGQSFDPELHEAVTQEESAEYEAGQIIGVLRKGYTLNDKVIRVAQVRVAR